MTSNKTLLFTFFRFKDCDLLHSPYFKKENDLLFKYDKNRYFEFIQNDILQLKESIVLKKTLDSKERLFFGDNERVKLKNFSISLVIFPKQCNGTFIFEYNWNSNGNEPLDELTEFTELRYLGTKDKFRRKENQLKTQQSERPLISWVDLVYTEFSQLTFFLDQIEYYSNKLGRVHLIDSNAVYKDKIEFLLRSYNAVRIVNKLEGEIESDTMDMEIFHDPRIKAFAMNEGVVLQEKGKTSQELMAKYSPIIYQCIFIKLGFTDVSFKLLSENSDIRINPRIGITEKSKIQNLRELRKVFLLLKFTSKIPISNYNEIEKIRSYFMKKFSSEIDFEEFSDSLEDLFEFLQDERDREDSERDEKINWILGVMGVTGFISFIFDYIFINGEVRLIDYLSGPTTWFPLISFIGVLTLLYKLNK